MDDKTKLLALLGDICPDVDFAAEENLIDDGLIESLDLVTIVSEIMAQFDVEISVNDLLPENFNSASAMLDLINAKRNG